MEVAVDGTWVGDGVDVGSVPVGGVVGASVGAGVGGVPGRPDHRHRGTGPVTQRLRRRCRQVTEEKNKARRSAGPGFRDCGWLWGALTQMR